MKYISYQYDLKIAFLNRQNCCWYHFTKTPTTVRRNFAFILVSIIVKAIWLQSCLPQTSNDISHMKVNIETQDSLSISQVKVIPSHVFDKTELKYLSVYGQDCDVVGIECFAISALPKKIKHLQNLEELHLPLHYITQLPIEMLELKQLKVLNLTENPTFSDIEIVSQMTWLKRFDCCGCNIQKSKIEKLKKKLPDCTIGIE